MKKNKMISLLMIAIFAMACGDKEESPAPYL
jgi:hypothetical protein